MATHAPAAGLRSTSDDRSRKAGAIIRLEGVVKSFDGYRALDGVDLEVALGERVVVCGPSGSGKSTLIRCINRLEAHDAGRITVDGIELDDDTRHVAAIRREVGMVFQ
ncbi:MAG: amino acid ABC transporter ATP-binding protein, partial [Geminicoccaceae bacterium]|nr:amino acid ABC transporter ATP-binding protein [Geminicoccaceae bacterium]